MKNTMKTYKIGVVWQMYGYVEVEANSLEEAVKEVVAVVVNIVLVVNLMVQVVLEEVVMEEILLVLLEQQTQVLGL